MNEALQAALATIPEGSPLRALPLAELERVVMCLGQIFVGQILDDVNIED